MDSNADKNQYQFDVDKLIRLVQSSEAELLQTENLQTKHSPNIDTGNFEQRQPWSRKKGANID